MNNKSTSGIKNKLTEDSLQNPISNPISLDRQGLSRRDFLKFMGASSVMALASCRRPSEQIVPAVIRSPETQPGIATFYNTVTPAGNNIIVRTREGRPIKIAANPEHPLSKGSVSASDVASLMDLYDPDRLRRSVKIEQRATSGAKFKRRYVKEELILPIAQAKLGKGDYVLLTGPNIGPSARALIQSFLKKYPKGRHIEFRPDPSLRQIAEGQKQSYGSGLSPFYRFDRAELILSIDGDFLGTMPLSSLHTRGYSQARNVQNGKKKMNRLLVFESMYSLTGSNADERYAIRPGDQSLIALSLAAHIVVEMRNSSFAKNPAIVKLLKSYKASNIASSLKHESALYRKGNFERIISRLAGELWKYRGRSLIIGGSPLSATGNNSSAQISFNLLNSILGNDGSTVDYKNESLLSLGASDRDIQSLVADLASGKVKTLIFSDANLVYHLPPKLNLEQVLMKGPEYILSLNDRIDETSRLAHAVLATNHYLESWGDSQLLSSLSSIQQPVIRPLHKTRSFEDRLIQLAGGELDGHKTFYEFLKSRWQNKLKGDSRNFKKSWINCLQRGYYAEKKEPLSATKSSSRSFITSSLKRLAVFKHDNWNKVGPKDKKFYLGLYYNLQVGDGNLANNAYRQELPEPVTKIVWDNYVCLLPETARGLGLMQGSLVKIKNISSKQSVTLPVHLQPGLHPQSALIPLGYGRTAAGKIANQVGQNANKLHSIGSDSITFSGSIVELIQSPSKEVYDLASTQVIYRNSSNTEEKAFFTPNNFHELPYRGSSQYGRPIIRESTFNEFKSGNFEMRPPAIKYPKKQELSEEWKYEGTRWHMLIDLNLCTGCGSCVTSCNSENNIPMVGKEEVKAGREMHWIRIDRYFSGEEDKPELAHQPMLCQHCENAPCENVCPVSATTHNSEGLNTMTYNRCIGTRYCANNCPYKVRRFNWFENWNYWEGFGKKSESPAHLSLNPDVTVRSRGVMEKCTFCVQRISADRQNITSNGTGNKNGIANANSNLKTACQEVCPTNAITFGNILDSKSDVAKLKKRDKRGYKVLDFLGVKPQVTYLAKLRNKERVGTLLSSQKKGIKT